MHVRIAAALLLAWVAVPAFVTAQSKPQRAKDLPGFYRNWLTRDAVYLITDDEKKSFLALPTDGARDEFIQGFWEVRNPVRGSKINPFKEEHYKRIEYANGHYGRQSKTPGWMTDMGRTYILFGPPESDHKFVGYGQIYPLDLWFYTNKTGNPGLPPFFYVLFYIPDDIGEYRFYRPNFDGPMKLVRGSNFHSNRDVYNFLKPIGGDIAHAVFSLVPNDPLDTVDYTPDMGSDMIVSRIQNFANDPFNVRKLAELRSLTARVNSYLLLEVEKKLEIASIVLTDPLGRSWLDFAVLIDDPKLGKVDKVNKRLNVSLAYSLYNEAGLLVLEDSEDTSFPAFNSSAPDAAFQPFLVANRLPMVPGNYRLTVHLNNREAGHAYQGEQRFSVGASTQATFNGPLLADAIAQAEHPDSLTPFQYFGSQFHPSPDRRFARSQPLRLLFEILQPPGPPRDWQLDYLIVHPRDREARQKLTDDAPSNSFLDGRLLKSKTISVAEFEPGDYRLIVNLRPAGSSEVIASVNLLLKIAEGSNDRPLFFARLPRSLANPGVANYLRGLEAASQKQDTAAQGYLAKALQETPSNTFAGQLLVQLYFNRRMFSSITALYRRLGIDPFKLNAETLAQIAMSFGNTGDRGAALNVIDAGRQFFPANPLLAQIQTRYRSAIKP